jgi:hypothetical protein
VKTKREPNKTHPHDAVVEQAVEGIQELEAAVHLFLCRDLLHGIGRDMSALGGGGAWIRGIGRGIGVRLCVR